jgi:hypothetical protein
MTARAPLMRKVDTAAQAVPRDGQLTKMASTRRLWLTSGIELLAGYLI